MLKLVLGVNDVPYDDGGATTGFVAKELEAEYGIMGHFVDMNADKIARMLAGDLRDALEGNPLDFKDTCEQMESDFKQALSSRAFDGITGVPTMAAQLGISHRFKNKKNKKGSRPSFIDTGAYQQSFRAEIKQK